MEATTAISLLELAESAARELPGLDARRWLGQLEDRHGDLLAAMQWFLDEGRTDEATRLAASLDTFWMATKRLDEGSSWFDRVLGAPGGTDDAVRGRAWFRAGLLAFWKGEDDRATTLHQRALELGRRIGDPTVVALALTGLARIALRSDIAEARRLCREAVAVTDGTDDRLGRSSAVHVLGVAAQMAGDLLEARGFMNERMALARELGSHSALSMEASNLSMVERQLGNLDRADALARESLGIFRRREDEWAFPYGLNSLAAVARDRGEHERAATLIGAAEAMMEDQGAAWPPDERPHHDQTVATVREAMGPVAFERVRAAGYALSSLEALDLAIGPAAGVRVADAGRMVELG